jgi:uncharacterized damage-inducible protein DinB
MDVKGLFSHWSQIRGDLLTTIDTFSDDELHYIPANTKWPVGKIMLHIADAEQGWFQYVVMNEIEAWPVIELEDYPDKPAIKEKLTEIHSRTEAYLSTLSFDDLEQKISLPWSDGRLKLGWIIWHVLEHEIHHRGELSLILGLLGREGLDV